MFLKRGVAGGILFLFFLLPLWAEENPPIYLGEIVVRPEKEVPSVIELTAGEIEIKNAHTVAEALESLEGIFVSVGTKNEPDIALRGISQEKVLILIDGVPLSSPYYGYVDLSQIPVENIAKIKVIKGPSSPLYGVNASGGVINILTSEPKLEPLTRARFTLANYNTRHYILTHAQTLGKFNCSLSGSHRESRGFPLSADFKEEVNEGGGKRENSDYKISAFSLKLGLKPEEERSLALFFNYLNNEKGVPPHTRESKPRYWRFPRWKRWTLALLGEKKFSPEFSLRGRAFYDKYDNILKSYDDSTYTTQDTKYAFTSTYDDYGVGASIHPSFTWGDSHLLKAGLHFKKDVHKEQGDSGQPWEEYKSRTYSLALENEFGPGGNLSFSLGAGYDFFDSEDKYVSTPNFYLKAGSRLSKSDLAWISFARKSRFPTLHQLYSTRSGNLNLEEERSYNYELGLEHRWTGRAKGSLTCFLSQVRDLIRREGKYDPYLNIARANFQGMEGKLQVQINRYLQAALGYTYLKAREKTDSREERLPYTPEQEAYFRLSYSAPSGFSCHLTTSYVGRRCWYDNDVRNELDDYWLWKARISRKLAENWELFISLDNLLDENYEEEEGFPQAGRTIWVGLKSKF
jgi:outer membrane cobalamin receptor